MMFSKRWQYALSVAACAGLTAALVLPGSAPADAPKERKSDKTEKESAEAAAAVAMAYELAEYGDRERVPEALITAARILRTTPISAEKDKQRPREGSGDGPATLAAEAAEPADPRKVSDAWLARAEEMTRKPYLLEL